MNTYKEWKLVAALFDRTPFYCGICPIPDHQCLLYYIHDDLLRRVDFSNAGADHLDELYRTCKPAEFGRDGENVLDESYQKAGKMDPISFSTLFDPRSLGIHEQVSKALLTKSHTAMNMELYKLNVYGKGDFIKAHKAMPRGQDMFGSLVVVLPTLHEGGQFVLRQEEEEWSRTKEKEWTLDFADKFASATEPSVYFIAFFGDTEHEVLPVTSGYRVTLTYSLYHKPIHPSASLIPTPFHIKLKQALVDLVDDKSTLPNGGYLGFGLVHEYVHTGRNLLDPLLDQLKGSVRALVDVCDELGLRYSLRLFYRGITESRVNLVTVGELTVYERVDDEPSSSDYLRQALDGLTIEQVEGIVLVGERHEFGPRFTEDGDRDHDDDDEYSWLKLFYRIPITEVLEITPMKSSVNVKTPFMAYRNEAELLDYFYGTACMLVAVEATEARDFVEL